jgi:hypothetical protein
MVGGTAVRMAAGADCTADQGDLVLLGFELVAGLGVIRRRAAGLETGSGQVPVQPPEEGTEPSVRVPSPCDHPIPAGLEAVPDSSRQ